MVRRCGYWIEPGTAWDLDHTWDRAAYLGASHRKYNRAHGAKTNQLRKRRKRCLVARLVKGHGGYPVF